MGVSYSYTNKKPPPPSTGGCPDYLPLPDPAGPLTVHHAWPAAEEAESFPPAPLSEGPGKQGVGATAMKAELLP